MSLVMEIKTGVLPPHRTTYGKWTDLFRQMKVNDFVEVDSVGVFGLQAAARRANGKVAVKKMATEKYRVWRRK